MRNLEQLKKFDRGGGIHPPMANRVNLSFKLAENAELLVLKADRRLSLVPDGETQKLVILPKK